MSHNIASACAGYFPELPPVPAPGPYTDDLRVADERRRRAQFAPRMPEAEKPIREIKLRADCYRSTREIVDGKKRCPQCWRVLPWPSEFRGRFGQTILSCAPCAKKSAERCRRSPSALARAADRADRMANRRAP
jgi:hypothetical protein